MQLTGWQIVAVLALACTLAIVGAVLGGAAATALVGLAGTIVGIVGGILTNVRSPNARTRATDRSRTSPLGVPVETTPPPVVLSPGAPEDRRKAPR